MGRDIGILVAQGLDVPMVPKSIPRWGTTPPNISQGSLKEQMDHRKGDRGLVSQDLMYQIFLRFYLGFQNLFRGEK